MLTLEIIYPLASLLNIKPLYLPASRVSCSHSCFLSGRSRPTITPDGPWLTVPLNGDFSLRCQSNSSVRWMREDRPTRTLKEEQRQGQLTVLKMSKAGPQHMGKYSCCEETGEKSSIYVYVKGRSAFCIWECLNWV